MSTPTRPPKPREPTGGSKLGTLVVVVYRAKNLPNKQRIGKQDPYCTITIGHQKQRTEAQKRGGQTPRWDKQLEFEIWQHQGDEVQAVTTETGGIGPVAANLSIPPIASTSKLPTSTLPDTSTGPPVIGKPRLPKSSTDSTGSSSSISGTKRLLKCACYADDLKEPDLIGEGTLDFASVLKKGEMDEWVELKSKGKYAGEVFLEMTFYASGPPPIRRPRPTASELDHGGPGSHEPSHGRSPSLLSLSPGPSSLRPSGLASPSGHLRQSQSQVFPSPSQSPIGEFGNSYRPSSTGTTSSTHSLHPARFPSPAQSVSSTSVHSIATHNHDYTPPYAQPSLAHSASHQTLRPQRASMSSFPASPSSDIDALLQPMSSVSIGKPLPMPDRPPSNPYGVPLPTSRPPSTQVSATQVSAVFPPAPSLQHHAASDAAVAYDHTATPVGAAHPQLSHRHSIQTYLPLSQSGHASDWNVLDRQNKQSGWPANAGHASSNSLGTPFVSQPSNSGWADPRVSSPQYAGFTSQSRDDYRQPSPSQPHGSALQSPGVQSQNRNQYPEALPPGRSPPCSQAQFTASPHSMHHVGMHQQLMSPSHVNNVTMYSTPLHHDDIYTYTTEQSLIYDQYTGQPVYQSPDADQNYRQDYTQAHQHQIQDVTNLQQPAPAPDGSQAHNVFNHLQESQNVFPLADGRMSSAYRPLPQPESHEPSANGGTPFQAGYADSQYGQYRQEQIPAPDRAPQTSHQAVYGSVDASVNGYSTSLNHSTSVSSQHQPRFGLPVHQPYDPPYVPPSARYSTSNYAEQPVATPALPPVPDDLRRESHQQQLYWEQQQQQQQQQQQHQIVQQQYGHHYDQIASTQRQSPYSHQQQYRY